MCSNQRRLQELQARLRGACQPQPTQYSYFGPYGRVCRPQPICNPHGKVSAPYYVVELPCPPPPPSCARAKKPQPQPVPVPVPAPAPSPQPRPAAALFQQGQSPMMTTVAGGTGMVEMMPAPSSANPANNGNVSEPDDDDGSDGFSDDDK